MSYMEKSFAFDSRIQSLSIEEINVVSGGADTSVPPGTCPPGYVVQSKSYDGAGNLVGVVCVPSSTSKQVQETSSTVESIVSVLNDVGEWVSSWF